MSPLLNPDALTDMLAAHERATGRVGRRIADAGTDRMERQIRRRTPIDTNPYRYRPERPRGTARASVHRLEGVRLTDGVWEGEVVSYDPVTRLLEFDTPPHVIRPRFPGGRLKFQSRDGWIGQDGTFHPPGTWVSVEEVHHPGTKGVHAFALGALDAEVMFDEYAAPELARWQREVGSGRF